MNCIAVLVNGRRFNSDSLVTLRLDGRGRLCIASSNENLEFNLGLLFHTKLAKVMLQGMPVYRLRLSLLPLTLIDGYISLGCLDKSAVEAWLAVLRQLKDRGQETCNNEYNNRDRECNNRDNEYNHRDREYNHREANDQETSNEKWRLSLINQDYSLCPTYPPIISVPTTISDSILRHAAKFRVRNRLPVLSFLAPPRGIPVCRSGQPLVGLQRKRSPQDERLLLEIAKCSRDSQQRLLIVDARPGINAMANTLTGAGFEPLDRYAGSQRVFVNIPNIHAVRRAFVEIYGDHKARVRRARTAFESATVSSVEESERRAAPPWKEWIGMLRDILEGTRRIVQSVHGDGIPVLVHCSDGWDRTAQLCSLAQICLDARCRTLSGLLQLIQHEWLAFGHRFKDRLGLRWDPVMGDVDIIESHEQWAPIFPQFIECLGGLIRWRPDAFSGITREHLRVLLEASLALQPPFNANSEAERTGEIYRLFHLPQESLPRFTGVLDLQSNFDFNNSESILI